MNVLLLAAGAMPTAVDSQYPLCLTEFNGTPLIQHIVERCNSLQPHKIIFAFSAEDIRQYHLDDVVRLLSPNATVLCVQGKTHGAACTALLAANDIDMETPLLIINANELLNADFSVIVQDFMVRDLDAGVVIFHSIHPRYSYVRLNPSDMVEETAEKRPISQNATVGFYWFKKGSDFVAAAKNMIRKDVHVGGNYYICPSLNELILLHKQIGVYRIDKQQYHPLKTERQLDQFEHSVEREKIL